MCLGPYTHPSQLLYPFSHENNFLCGKLSIYIYDTHYYHASKYYSLAVDKAVPGEAILQKFKVHYSYTSLSIPIHTHLSCPV